MGTGGIVGFIIAGTRRGSYNSHDSFPDALGANMVRFILSLSAAQIDRMAARLRALEWVDEDMFWSVPGASHLELVLEGSVRRLPDQIRIFEEWTGNADEFEFWANFEDRTFTYMDTVTPFSQLKGGPMDKYWPRNMVRTLSSTIDSEIRGTEDIDKALVMGWINVKEYYALKEYKAKIEADRGPSKYTRRSNVLPEERSVIDFWVDQYRPVSALVIPFSPQPS